MPQYKNNAQLIIGLISFFIVILLSGILGFYLATKQQTVAYRLPLEGKALAFANRYPSQDCIVIFKSKHLLYYCKNGYIARNAKWGGYNLSFPAPIAIGMGGRHETPVGEYYICQKNQNSKYTLFLGLSWPNIADVNKAVEMGSGLSASDYRRIVWANILRVQPPWDTPLGGTYGIHGAPTYLRYAIDRMEKKNPNLIYVTKRDNTRGCVAVEHRYLKYLYANVDEGTPVLILN